jgi:hypothetical protein
MQRHHDYHSQFGSCPAPQAVGFAEVQVVQEVLQPDEPGGGGAEAAAAAFCAVIGRTPRPPERTADNVEDWLVPPALHELGSGRASGSAGATAAGSSGGGGAGPLEEPELQVSEAALERWRYAYRMLVADARDLGIPASAVPLLPEEAGPEQIRRARDHLQKMVASFLSSGL